MSETLKGAGVMSSLLKSTLNTRTLPGCGLRFIRSDVPLQPAQEEINWLMDNDIRVLVDLRSGEETEKHPCPLASMAEFSYHHMPVTGGGNTPKSRAHLHEVYGEMVDGQMDRILETILRAPHNVMFFCTAGKDRTGVVSALLLKKLGCDDQTIIADYMKSGDNLKDMLKDYVRLHPEVDLDIIMPKEENIEKILERL